MTYPQFNQQPGQQQMGAQQSYQQPLTATTKTNGGSDPSFFDMLLKPGGLLRYLMGGFNGDHSSTTSYTYAKPDSLQSGMPGMPGASQQQQPGMGGGFGMPGQDPRMQQRQQFFNQGQGFGR